MLRLIPQRMVAGRGGRPGGGFLADALADRPASFDRICLGVPALGIGLGATATAASPRYGGPL